MDSSLPKFILIATLVAILAFALGLPKTSFLLNVYEVLVVFLGATGFSAVLVSAIGNILSNFPKELIATSFFGSLVSYISLVCLVTFPTEDNTVTRFEGLTRFFEDPSSYGVLVLILFALSVVTSCLYQLKLVIEDHQDYIDHFKKISYENK